MNCQQLQPHVSEAEILKPGISFRTVFMAEVGAPSYDRDFDITLNGLVEALPQRATIAEYGAGANPHLESHRRILKGDVSYLRIDVSAHELAKSSAPGESVIADVSTPDLKLPCLADLALSRMLAEHVSSGSAFLANVFRNLAPGGQYIQVSPVLYTIPFVANRLLPERIADRTLASVAPRDRERLGKFPAHYSLCRGPSPRHLRKLETIGFRVDAARGYFGHTYYDRIPLLRALERKKTDWLVNHPIPNACAYTILVLSRPR